MKKARILFLLLALTLIISSVVVIGATATEEKSKSEAPYEYVVVLGVDALGNFTNLTDTPNIDAIFSGGATTDYALVENPSASAQGWGSLLIGESADVHGLTNYSIMEAPYSNDKLPTIFKLLSAQDPDAKMVSYCSWNSINNGIIEENIPGLEKKQVGDAYMASNIATYFSNNGAPDLLFCQFNNLDAIGHNTGYGNKPEFLEGVRQIDAYIGEIYNIYKNAGILDKTLFIVTGDHGGINTTHGGWTPEEKYVFYGVAGKGVNETNDLDMFIRDTPAIICHALGIKGTEGWDSYVPEGLFVDGDGLLKRPPEVPELIYPNTTPEASDEKYIGNYIDIDDLKAGFFFDGDLSNFVEDSDVELGRYVGAFSEKNVGTIYYPSGLYSESVRVSYEGYLATEDLNLDNNSFSIGLWVSLDPMSSAQLVWSTKRWTDADGIGNFNQQGILIRNVYSNSNRYLGLNMGSGAYSVNGVNQTPTSVNYYYDDKNNYEPKEWVHTLMVVDRDAKLLKYYVNFELAYSIDLSRQAWFTEDYDIDPHDVFMLGQDITGVYPSSLEGSMDDLLIWNTAVDADTIASLKAYYADAFYDYDFSISGSPSTSTSPTDEIKMESGATNTDNTPFIKIESSILSGILSESAKYEIVNGFDLSQYPDADYYIVDFDIATASNYLPMNISTVISGNKGSTGLEAPYGRITADGVFVGTLNGHEITRTLTLEPYAWQHVTMVYDLVGGDDGYPLYIYFNGDLISNAEWMNAASKANGELPAAIGATEFVINALANNSQHNATTLLANATSALYTDDKYGNLLTFFSSGAGMSATSDVLDFVYSDNYALPVSDYLFSSNGVGYREFATALGSGNGTIDVLHNDFYTTYTVTDPCTINTNGFNFSYDFIDAINKSETTDSSGNKVLVFISEPPTYTLTFADGSVKNYYAKTSLKDILTVAQHGSTIKLYADIDVTADYDSYSKTINLDLNGYTVSNTGGYIRLYDGAGLNVYGGKIVDSNAKEFIYMGNSSPRAFATVTNCTITADRTFAEVRSGTLKLIDCTYTHTGNFQRFANCASGGYTGDKAVVYIENTTMNLGSATFITGVRADSYTDAAHIDVTIKDSEIKTTGNLFNLSNKTADKTDTPDIVEGAPGSSTKITVTGKTKLAYNKFDIGGFTVPDTTVTFGLGVAFSAEPTIAGAKIVYSDGADGIKQTGDSEYPYVVGKADPALYVIKTSAGVETKYYEEMTFQALIALAPSGSTITLHSDIDLTADLEIINKVFNVNLNGYTISNTGGFIRLYTRAVISIYGGKITDSAEKEFIYLGNGATGTVANITNCIITANKNFAEVRSGEINLIDCTYTHAGSFNRFANCSSGSNEGDIAIVNIDGCTMDLGSALLISAERAPSYSDATNIQITINDSEIKTTGKLLHLKNTTAGAADSVTTITVSGESKLAYSQLDGGGATVPDTTVTLALGVMLSAEPIINGATIAFSDGGEGIASSGDANYPYIVSKDDSVLYSITTSTGAVTKYYEVMGLRDLIALAPNGSTITLYANIDLSSTSETNVSITLTIDLNGYQITNTGERLNVKGNGHLTLKNGTLNDCGNVNASGGHVDKDFVDIPKGETNAKITIDKCDIIGNGYFMDLKAGSATVKNSTFVPGGKKVGALANMLAAGLSASLTIENCDIDVGSGAFVTLLRASGYPTEMHSTVTVKDSTITTKGNLFNLTNTVSASVSSHVFTFTGKTYLTFNSVDGGTCTTENTTLNLGLGVKMSKMPTLTTGTVMLIGGGDEIKQTGNTDYPYEVSEAAGYLYTITTSTGEITKYYEAMGLRDLIALAPNGSTITLYADIDLSSTSETDVKIILTIDLNGHQITNTGNRLNVRGNGHLTLKNGTLNDCGTVNSSGAYVDKDFVDIPKGETNAKITIDKCNIIANSFFMDIKAGSVTVKNSTFVNGGKKAGAFANMLAAGDIASLTVEGCNIDVGTASFITLNRADSYATEAHATVTIKDSTIKTSGTLFGLTNKVSSASSSNVISITGATYLTFASFDGGTCGVDNTTVSLGKGVKLSATPTIAKGTIVFTDGGKIIAETGDDEYPYEVIDGELTYTVKMSNGSVKNIYREMALQDIFALADSGSVITLYKDVVITAAVTLANKNIEIDLNGHTLTSDVRTRLEGSTLLYIHGGTVVDGSADFVFIPSGNSSAAFKVEKCVVNINGKLVDARGGSVEIIDSVCTATTATAFAVGSQGGTVKFKISGSTIDLGSANLASTYRGTFTDTVNSEIVIYNSTITTKGDLFYLFNDGSENISKIIISITGSETKLSYASFGGDSCNVPDTVVTIGLGIMMNKLPSIASGSIVLGEGAKGIASTNDADYPYVVSEKSSITAKPYFSLTLYSDFTLNLSFRESEKDRIVKVMVGNTEIEPVVSNGMVFYPIKNIAAYNAAEIKEIKVTYLIDKLPLEAVLNYSVIDYANALLASNYSVESKELLCRTIDYVKAAYEYAGIEVPTSVTNFIASDAYKAISTEGNVTKIPESTTAVGDISAVIQSAQINLASELRFRFNIKSGVNAQLTIKTRTLEETYEIVDGLCEGKSYIVVKMRAFDMFDGVMSFSSNEASGTYDLKAYANSDAIDKDTTGMLGSLLLSLYNYCREANEYMKVQDKDFISSATVVVKDGKAGTVTYVVDDGRADTAERLEPMLDSYDNLKLTFALIASKYATLTTRYNEETGKHEYVMDENGKYVYTVNEEAASYWRTLVEKYGGRVEYSNHSFTHGFAGYNDEGGTVSYVDTNGNVRTVILPVGSATAELYAAIQVFSDLFGVEVKTLVMPGVAANRTDVVVNGVTYHGWIEYYNAVVARMYADGILVGARGDGFGEANMSENFLILPERFGTEAERLNIPSYTAKDVNSFESWTQYIDYATESGGWANFCLHQIFTDDTVSEAFHLKEYQAKALFSYTNRDDVWVANYEEAAKYYAEWATAEVSVSSSNGVISVTLTDGENNDVYDEALTVKVSVPTSWNECLVNGSETVSVITDASGNSYVYVNIVPDSGVVTIVAK